MVFAILRAEKTSTSQRFQMSKCEDLFCGTQWLSQQSPLHDIREANLVPRTVRAVGWLPLRHGITAFFLSSLCF